MRPLTLAAVVFANTALSIPALSTSAHAETLQACRASAADSLAWDNIERRQQALQAAGETIIALTFDDGPDGTYTKRIAETLDQHGVQATFFVVGHMTRSYPGTVRDLARRGHEIAVHSNTHAQLDRLSIERLERDFEATDAAVQAETGQPARFFRPPYGAYNRSVTTVASKHGHPTVLWTLDPLDWRSSNSAEAIENSVVSRMRPGDIILLHSINGRTAAAVPGILERAKARGFTFVTMSEWADRAARAECSNRNVHATTEPHSDEPSSPPKGKRRKG